MTPFDVSLFSALLLPMLIWLNLEPDTSAQPLARRLTFLHDRRGASWWGLPLVLCPCLAWMQLMPALGQHGLAPLPQLLATLGWTALLLGLWCLFRLAAEARVGHHPRYVAVLPILAMTGGMLPMLRSTLHLPADFLARFAVACLVMAFCEVNVVFRAQRARLRDAEDAAARVRLAPHFLFNVFNTLHAQIARDAAGAQATTEHLARLFRQLLTLVRRPLVTVAEELAFVEDLLALQRLRLGERLQVVLEVPEALEAFELPTLALQTLVENAVKHGVEPREAGGTVYVALRAEVTRMGAFGPKAPEPTQVLVRSDPDAASPAWTDLVVTVSNPLGGRLQSGTGTGLDSLRARLRRPEDLEIRTGGDTFTAILRWRQA